MKLKFFPAVALGTLVIALSSSCKEDSQKAKLRFAASGDRLVAQKNYSEAIIQYRNAVAKDPSFGEARFKLASAYESTGDLRNSLREFVRAADLMPGNAQAQIRAGRLLGASGQFAEAKARAAAALSVEPRNVEALIVLGNALAGMKDLQGAVTQMEAAIDAAPRFEFSYANLGLIQLKKGDRSAAEDAFKRVLEVAPKSSAGHLNLGNFYWASNRREDAEKEFKAAYAIDPESVDVNRVLSAFYALGPEKAAAEPFLKKYAEKASGVLPRLALADFYMSSSRTTQALELLEPLSKEPDGFGHARIRIAWINYLEGRRVEAYQDVETILKRFPNDEVASEAKARFLIGDAKYEEALAITNVVVQRNPGAARAQFIRGVALQALNRADESIKAFLRVLELVPSAMPAYVQLTNLYLAKNDTKAALDFLGRLIASQPRSSVAHMLMGQALLQAQNPSEAERHLLPVARANPSSSEAQIWLGRLYLAKNDRINARLAFKRANTLQPDSIVALNGLVTLDVIERKSDAARTRLEQHLAAAPNDAALTFLAANSYLNLGERKRAEQLFKRVLEIDPANIAAYGGLAGILLADHRLDEGRAELEEAIRRNINVVPAKTMIGVILELQKKPDEARAQYEEALALNPRAAVAANNLAWHYAERGKLDMALQLSQTAKAQLPNDSRVSDTLGWIYYKKGLTSLAVTALRQSVEQNPQSPTSHYHLGLAYLKDGNQLEARLALERALKLDPKFAASDDAKKVLASIRG
jgi:tetratricopeptide (TPR) repeat protein